MHLKSAFFHFSVKNFSKTQVLLDLPKNDANTVYSERFVMQNEVWRLYVRPSEDQKALSIYMQFINLESPVQACCSFKLISHVNKQHNVTRKVYHEFGTLSRGWCNFISWSKLEDVKFGYIKDGKVTVEVEITLV